MRSVRDTLNKCLKPPEWVVFAASLLVFSVLSRVLGTEEENTLPAYLVYGLSAYCLICLVLIVRKDLPAMKRAFLRVVTGTEFGERYVHDLAFRGSIGIYQGMTVNFLYTVFRVWVGLRYASVWFLAQAVYYLMLGVLRLMLIVSDRHRNGMNAAACYRRTAWLLLLLNLPMGGMILLTVLTDSGYSYPGHVIYVSAFYTFYTLTTAVMNLVRFRRLGDPLLSAAKVLNFVSAMVSVLGLQTAMLAQFSAENGGYRVLMNALTGGCVWVSIIFISVYMLRRSKREVKAFAKG